MLGRTFEILKTYPLAELMLLARSDPRLAWNYHRRSLSVARLPARMMLDPHNFCNLKCRFCPTGAGKKGNTKASMSFELFEHIINLNPRLHYLDIYSWGESFLNKDIFSMIALCRKRRIRTNIHSTLSFCGSDFVERIVQTPPDRLSISLDGLSQESCEEYQVGIDFDCVRSNLEHLSRIRKRQEFRFEVQWKYLFHRYNLHELEPARQLASHWGFTFVCYPLKTPHNQAKEWHGNSGDGHSTKKSKNGLGIACPHLWFRPRIDSLGNLTPCCLTYFDDDRAKEALSELSSPQELLDLWNSSYFQRGRRCFTKDAHFTEIDQPTACEGCGFYKRRGGLYPQGETSNQENIFAGSPRF